MNFNELPLSKASLRAHRKRMACKIPPAPENGYTGPENLLEGQIEDTLDALSIEFRRIPDVIWFYLKRFAPVQMVNALVERWRGKPDILMLLPVSDKYSLCAEVELKSYKGKLSTRQEDYKGRMPVQISRSPEKNIDIIRQFQTDAAIVKGLFEAQALNAGNNKTEK